MADATRADAIRADTIWALVERRAEGSPDRTMLIDEQDRTVTFGGFRDRRLVFVVGLLCGSLLLLLA